MALALALVQALDLAGTGARIETVWVELHENLNLKPDLETLLGIKSQRSPVV